VTTPDRDNAAVIIARAESPRGEVVLAEREGGVLELRVNGVFVMDTAETTSETALSTNALALVEEPTTVLVGGLGMGFTAHALLGDQRVERIDVVELEGALVQWMRDGTIPHGPGLLADERLRVVEADLALAVEEVSGPSYDLVLLDVDNGPGNLVHTDNARIYRAAFLRRLREVLKPGGALAIWSSHDAPGLEAELRDVFGNAMSEKVPVTLQGRDEAYWLVSSSR